MARRIIHNELDRENRNNHNENYIELYEKILRVNKMISDLVIESGGDSSSEVIHARGGFPLLGNRLDILDEEIAKKVDRIEARLRTQKIEPEDASERLLELITGDGEINLLTIPQDNSVTMPKFEPGLRQDFQDLFGAFVEQNDFIPLELFDEFKVMQGGVTSSGTTDSLTRTHIEIDVHPGRDYYVTIPGSEYLRLRSISTWNNDTFIEWNQRDNIFTGNSFTVSEGANKAIVSFCKVDINEELTPSETASETVSIFELRFNPRNLIEYIVQGGSSPDGFSDSPNRTRTEIIKVKELSIVRFYLDTSKGIYVRNVRAYKGEDYLETIYPDDLLDKRMFTTPAGADGIVLSFAREDTSARLTPEATLEASPKLEEAYR